MTYPFLYRQLVERKVPFIQSENGYYYSLDNWLYTNGWGGITIFGGSFNPLHDGHIEILDILRSNYSYDVFAEISIHHVSKPSITENDLYDRLLPFVGRYPVLVTDEPLIVNKLGILKEHGIARVTMAMGADVAHKFIAMHGKLFVSALNTSFEVFGRNGTEEIKHPPRNMNYHDIPNAKYRGMSSTAIREGSV